MKIRRNGLRPLANIEAGATLPKVQKPRVIAYTKTLATTSRGKKQTGKIEESDESSLLPDQKAATSRKLLEVKRNNKK